MVFGFGIDFVLRFKYKNQEAKIVEMCEKDHCHCENGIIKSAFHHTIHIFVFILIVVFLLNTVIFLVGEENISKFLINQPVLGPVISSLIGLIPNCASSVIITELYLENVINVGTLIAGLLVNAGVGLVVLFKTNKGLKENVSIVGLLYLIGVLSGIVIQLLGFSI